MDEVQRLNELYAFKILDTPLERKLNDITKIAAALCDVPISLISLIDKDRLWFKAKMGIQITETDRNNSFCKYALDQPNAVLIVDDPVHDPRCKENPLVNGATAVRYYAGVPIKTTTGAVLGTLCVLDTKKRALSPQKLEALQLLSQEVMLYLDTRKIMLSQSQKTSKNTNNLKNFSGQSKSVFMQLEVLQEGKVKIGFLSDGIQYLCTNTSIEHLKSHPKKLLDLIYEDDYNRVMKAIVQAFVNTEPFELEFRVERDDKTICWYQGVAKTEKRKDDRVIWHATFQDVSNKKLYVNALEQMSFDISHVLRKPITTLMSILSVIEIEKDIDEESLKMYAGYLKSVGEELDKFTKMLNESYYSKWIGTQNE